eukprot:scaffold4011_cov197-Ochromonas_danica.AAC.13
MNLVNDSFHYDLVIIFKGGSSAFQTAVMITARCELEFTQKQCHGPRRIPLFNKYASAKYYSK